MSALNAPFGFTPVYHPSGIVRPRGYKQAIPSGFATQILKGQVVTINGANGNVEPIAANNVDFVGVFAGCEFLDAFGRPTKSPYWPAGQVLQSALEMIVWLWDDPLTVFRAQADGSVARTALGREFNTSNFAAGSTLTGQSQATLAATPIVAASQGQWYCQDVDRDPANDWGDAFTVLQVVMARSIHVSNKVGI